MEVRGILKIYDCEDPRSGILDSHVEATIFVRQ